MVLQDQLTIANGKHFAALEDFVGERKRLIEVVAWEKKSWPAQFSPIPSPKNVLPKLDLHVFSSFFLFFFLAWGRNLLDGEGIFSTVKMSQGKLPLHPSR